MVWPPVPCWGMTGCVTLDNSVGKDCETRDSPCPSDIETYALRDVATVRISDNFAFWQAQGLLRGTLYSRHILIVLQSR